mgnify:CR=1 FL=1
MIHLRLLLLAAFLLLLPGHLFAALQIGGLGMQRNVNVPWQIALVLQSIVIIMLAGRFAWSRRQAAALSTTTTAQTWCRWASSCT